MLFFEALHGAVEVQLPGRDLLSQTVNSLMETRECEPLFRGSTPELVEKLNVVPLVGGFLVSAWDRSGWFLGFSRFLFYRSVPTRKGRLSPFPGNGAVLPTTHPDKSILNPAEESAMGPDPSESLPARPRQ